MADKEKSLVKKAVKYFNSFAAQHCDEFVFHDQIFIEDRLLMTREIAKGEGLDKEQYALGLVALILCDIGVMNAADKKNDNHTLVKEFLENNVENEQIKAQVWHYIDFLQSDKLGQNLVERVLRDGKYIHLGMTDALERMELFRVEVEKVKNKTYTDLEWVEKCKQYFIKHSLDTRYANSRYGPARSKNYLEMEKRLDKLRADDQKEKKASEKLNEAHILSDKEGQDLFKIAFRNYLDLVGIADKKAGLLIQVNTILASVVGAFGVRRLEDNVYYAFPTAAILVGAAVTVFFAILASKPLGKKFYDGVKDDREAFFFGSFDKLDPEFKDVTWDKYSKDITQFFNSEKTSVFNDLIKESFEVRKVLSKKFIYLSHAYKVFFVGLLLGILGFLGVVIYEYYFVESIIQAAPL